MTLNDSAASIQLARSAAGLMRRLAAMLYDALPLIAILMLATLPFVPFLHGRVLVPQEVGWLAYVYRAWMLVVLVVFFGYCWTRSGQTIGMQAWRLRIEDERGELLRWPQAIRRVALAAVPWLPGLVCFAIAEQLHSALLRWTGMALLLIGLSALAMLWLDPQRRTWHDRQSRSRVVLLPKARGKIQKQ